MHKHANTNLLGVYVCVCLCVKKRLNYSMIKGLTLISP